ncbi:DUF4333 domain-containing protein [Mycolicibacterium austroafricanum]|uniref:DUF4333 domain-containing protein n=1 Tax=Mycolicibacterium austroafricanum TaxID=39687 RepID=UPI000A009A8B|nr:DUF4333 domain-containing protein [Mycolicibacterium austroafricanum]QZY47262.1 DUF4333 domain-containing protein [Mycolicibacterium austroafricanum]
MKQSRRRVLVAAGLTIVAVEAIVLTVALWFFGYFDDQVLNISYAEAGVRQILTDPIYGYGANNVASVRCNDGRDPKIVKGKSFVCEVIINGSARQVQVVFRDDSGTYEVDGPR